MARTERSQRVSALALLSLGVGLGCAHAEPATAHQLRSRAAFELECPAEQLVLVRIDQTTGGVAGCGRRVVYVETCRSSGQCSWAFDREATPPEWVSWTGTAPRMSPYPGDEPPRGSPYPPARAPEQGSGNDSKWRSRVPALLRDDPGF